MFHFFLEVQSNCTQLYGQFGNVPQDNTSEIYLLTDYIQKHQFMPNLVEPNSTDVCHWTDTTTQTGSKVIGVIAIFDPTCISSGPFNYNPGRTIQVYIVKMSQNMPSNNKRGYSTVKSKV